MNVKDALYSDVFKILNTIATTYNKEAYVVGGFVRDYFLGIDSKDIDIVTVGSGIELAKLFAEAVESDKVVTYENFGTAAVDCKYGLIEFVGARKESYRKDSRFPIVENGSFYDDLVRRDLTINTLAIALHSDKYGDVIDMFGGLSDLREGIIRTPVEADKTFSDDPLRMLRAIRFACKYKFTIEAETFDSISRNKERIKIISASRINEELNKILLSTKPSIGFKYLFDSGLLSIILPELSAMQGIEEIDGIRHKDNFYHTIKVVDNVCSYSNNLWLRWAALLHDIGKPKCKRFQRGTGWTFHGHEELGSKMVEKIFKRLKLPLNDDMKRVQRLVAMHARPTALFTNSTDSGIRRLIVDAQDILDDLLKLVRADITTKHNVKWVEHQENIDVLETRIKIVTEQDNMRNWRPAIGGEEIMDILGLKPGPEVGRIKKLVTDAILDGVIPNEKESAIEYIKQC